MSTLQGGSRVSSEIRVRRSTKYSKKHLRRNGKPRKHSRTPSTSILWRISKVGGERVQRHIEIDFLERMNLKGKPPCRRYHDRSGPSFAAVPARRSTCLRYHLGGDFLVPVLDCLIGMSGDTRDDGDPRQMRREGHEDERGDPLAHVELAYPRGRLFLVYSAPTSGEHFFSVIFGVQGTLWTLSGQR